MNARTLRAGRAALLGACLLGALSLVSGCSKKLTSVDASYTTPEGTLSADAQLILYPDLPVTIEEWLDRPEVIGEGQQLSGTWNPQSARDPSGDSLLSESQIYVTGPGLIHGIIVNRSAASGFQMFRREPGGGMRAYQDFALEPERRWLDGQSELYAFTDPSPSGFTPPSYMARGLLQGQVRANSPLTNEARLSALDVADINYTGSITPPDSLFQMTWDPVPGAAAYWVHIYDFMPNADDYARRVSAAPAPLNILLTRDYLVGLLPASMTSYRVGDPGPVIFTYRSNAFRMSNSYQVRISAVTADGRLLAYTRGYDRNNAIVIPGTGVAGRLIVSARGAIQVTPTRR